MPGPSAGSDPKYDKKTINMLSNMSTRDRNKFVRDNASTSAAGMKAAKAASNTARKAADKDTAKSIRKLGRQEERTVRKQARQADRTHAREERKVRRAAK